MGVARVGSAFAAVAPRDAAVSSPCPLASCVAVAVHARHTVSPMHDAQNSRVGGSQGPRGRRCSKGGVSGLAEDLRPVSEVEAGVNFRPAGGVRGQVAGPLPGRQPGTGTTPSLHPEGSWYPIRVTWIRIRHQAINGLDEGVFDRLVGDLGAKV